MALYQFVIELIPEDWIKNNANDVNQLYEDNMYDLSVTWSMRTYNNELEKDLTSILPKSKSWASDLFVWGDVEKSDIQVLVNGALEIESIKFRIDLREKYDSYVNKFLAVANKMGCLLFIPENKKIIKPNPEELIDCINLSNAAKYLHAPIEYLENHSKKES